MNSVTIYIALYRTVDPQKFHWAMVVPREGTVGGFVRIYDIKQVDETWKFFDIQASLKNSSSLIGCIRLPAVKASFSTIGEQFQASEVGQAGTTLPYTHTKWTCALWIMRELHELQRKGLVELGFSNWSDAPSFYLAICKKAIKFRDEIWETVGGTVFFRP
jgi:hypothetical protein